MMKYARLVFTLFIFVSLSFSAQAKPDPYFAAANNNLNFREANSYPQHTAERDIEVGIERINKDDMERLLGNDTGKFEMFDVALTNNSDFRIYLNRIAIKYIDGTTSAQVDLSDVINAIDPGGSGNKDDMRDAVLRTNILNKSLPHSILNPGETVQGLIFVEDKKMSNGTSLYLEIQNLKRVAYLDFTMPLKN